MSSSLRLAAQALALLVVAGLVGLFVWRLAEDEGTEIVSEIQAGKTPAAPNFTLPRLDRDGQVGLASFDGVVVLNFWASWCVPCKHEAPRFQDAWERYQSKGLVVLGVDTLDFKASGRSFIRKYGVTYPNGHDGRGLVLEDYGGIPLPKTFFLRRGKIVAYIFGEAREEDLTDAIERALRSSP